MRISDWSSYVCSSDLLEPGFAPLLDRSQHGHLGRLERAERDFGACNLAGEIGMPQDRCAGRIGRGHALQQIDRRARSEEHTTELQSLMRISYAVFCLIKKIIKMSLSSPLRSDTRI